MSQDELFLLILGTSLRLLDKASFLVQGDFRIFVPKVAIGFKHGGILYKPYTESQIKNKGLSVYSSLLMKSAAGLGCGACV